MVIVVVLAIGAFAFLWWRWRYTTLTRDCRWRQSKATGDWHCAFCGERAAPSDGQSPRHCARPAPR